MAGSVAVVGFASIGGLMFGLDQGNWGGAIVKEGFTSHFCEGHCPAGAPVTECNCQDSDLFPRDYYWFLAIASAMLQIGAAVGALTVAPFLASRWGRRETMFVGAVVTACGIAPCMFLTAYVPFAAARFVAGTGVGLMTVALPMYICEVAPTQIRGILGSMMQLACQSGLLFAALINLNLGFEYYWSFALPMIPAAVVAAGIFFFPMSPRFALLKFKRKQQPDEGVQRAKVSLRRLRGNEVEADKELFELQQAMDSETQEAPLWTLVSDASILKRVLVAMFLQVAQQFTGINAILGYGPTIFINAGVRFTDGSSATAHIEDGLIAGALVNVCLLVSVIATMFVIDLWGRRFLLLLGGVVMTVSMSVAAIFAKMVSDMEDDPTTKETRTMYGYVVLVAVCFYMLGFGPWGAIPWVYPSEIFPMDVKEKAMSVSTFVQWAANATIAFLVPLITTQWHPWGILAFFAVCCGVVVVMAPLIVPEIRGVRMEDMESIFGARKTAPQERLTEV